MNARCKRRPFRPSFVSECPVSPDHNSSMVLRIITATLLTALAAIASANPELDLPEVKSAAALDGTFNMIEDGEGKVVLISENTRYVLKSFVLVDTWNSNVKVTNPDQLRALQETIPLRMIPFDRILYFDVPESPLLEPDLIAYVDPHLESSRLFIDQARDSNLKVRLIPVPFSGEASFEATRRLSCASQGDARGLASEALISGDYDKLPAKDCQSHDKLRAAVITAQMIGAKGTPFIMAADGRYSRGLPPDLKAFAKASPLLTGVKP